jgi:hypothetical protein
MVFLYPTATDQFAAYLKEYTVNFTNEESYSFAESYVRDLKVLDLWFQKYQ